MSPRSSSLPRIVAGTALAASALVAPPLLAPAQAGLLFCDDAPGSENVKFAASAYAVTEEQRTAEMVVNHLPCAGSGGNPAQVDWSVTGGTASAEDYAPAAGTLTFPAGDFNDRAISLTITNDTTPEPAETVIVTLTPGNEATGIMAPGTATVTISPSDVLPPTNNTAPQITKLRPAPGSIVRDRTPLIAATVSDRQSNLSARAIRLFVDGRSRSFAYNRVTDRLQYTSTALARGRHAVRVRAVDPQGRATLRSWSFRVGDQSRASAFAQVRRSRRGDSNP